eukprot:CAMPEP_0198299750 /NCGR_PEP_ID=MMETSP1449-20131203/45667_1 /TAXON_ID=420275 /ORGANISM="Attheya septentrionalis, Strain CCMP2084" /LENGTH=556 /DNA_ID=CAMNT_0044001385 /DNA_START=92 /DNA_END=1759 /DNA_ORIENTATION=+
MNDYGDSSTDVVVQTYDAGDTHTIIDPEEWPAPYQTDAYTSDLHVVTDNITPLELNGANTAIHASHNGNDDEEMLVPPHFCPTRKSTLLTASMNLVATIIGGGVLSLPYAFHKAGIVLATIMMILSALMTDFSLLLLCSSARKLRGTSYGHVCFLAYGPSLERFTTILIFVFLLFVICAFMVLARDIWTPLLSSNQYHGNLVLFGLVVLMGPFLMQRDLHSLRYNCYLGFASVSILCAALVYRAFVPNPHDENDGNHLSDEGGAHNNNRNEPAALLLFTSSFGDALLAFPIINLSFLSSFNILSVHGALIQPTRRRIRTVIHSAVTACFCLTYVFGLAGYWYARDATEGNILLNFDFSDPVILAGRMGCGINILLAMAMVTLPCRESALVLWAQLVVHSKSSGTPEQHQEYCRQADERRNDSSDSEKMPLVTKESCQLSKTANTNPHRRNPATYSEKGTEASSLLVLQDLVVSSQNEWWMRMGSTVGIVSVCYLGAVAAPGVAIVWSLCGSSMAYIIAFILPAACYIRVMHIRRVQLETESETTTTTPPGSAAAAW